MIRDLKQHYEELKAGPPSRGNQKQERNCHERHWNDIDYASPSLFGLPAAVCLALLGS